MFHTGFLPVVAVTFVASYGLVGLLAIWVALGRRPHWFLRVAVWANVVLTLLAIPAYEPMLLFSIQLLVAAVPLAVVRTWRERRAAMAAGSAQAVPAGRWRPQFQILDLLLLTVLVAVVTAVVVNAPSDMWKFWDFLWGHFFWEILYRRFGVYARFRGGPVTPSQALAAYILFGLGMGISTLAAAWIALSRRRSWLRLAGLLLVPTSALMAVWLVLIRALGWLPGAGGRLPRPRARRLTQVAAGLLSLAIVFPPVATLLLLTAPIPEPPRIILPNPNGYDDLCRAATALSGVGVPWLGDYRYETAEERESAIRDYYETAEERESAIAVFTEEHSAFTEELSAFVAEYGHVLEAARIGLDRPCVVPLQYTDSDDDWPWEFETLASAFRAEGELARVSSRPDDAVRSSFDLMRLGQASSRGGRLNDWSQGLYFRQAGIRALAGLREDLDASECREVMDNLRRLDVNREPLGDVAERDELYNRIVFGKMYEMYDEHWLRRWDLMVRGSGLGFPRVYREFDDGNEAQLRMLLCALALRCYRLEHGELPPALADLVPKYLPEVPVDPFSGKPLIYRRQGGEYLLYSVGPDGDDDGGKSPYREYAPPPAVDQLLEDPVETNFPAVPVVGALLPEDATLVAQQSEPACFLSRWERLG